MSSRVDRIVELTRGPAVLDVGCAAHSPDPGNPAWLFGRVKKRFPSAWGVDVSPGNIKELKQAGYSNVAAMDAQSLSLPVQFDTIIAGDVVEHLENPAGFLRSASALLKEGGRIIVTTPSPFALPSIVYATFRFPKTCANEEHVAWFCQSTFHSLVERVGLEVLHWELIDDFSPGGKEYREGKVRRSDLRYRAFIRFLRLMKWILPRRLYCVTQLFVVSQATQDGVLRT